jgi:hypothetical protein
MTPAVACHGYATWVLWALGYADQALRQGYEALTQAQMLVYPLSVEAVSYMLGMLHLFRGEGHAAQQQAEASLQLATEDEFAQRAVQAMIVREGALIVQGHDAEGIDQVTHGLAETRHGGRPVPAVLSLLAGRGV